MYVSESCYFLRTCRKRSKQKDPFLLNSANLRFSLLLPSQSPHPHLLVWSKSFFAHFAFICSFLFAKRKRKKNYFKLFLVYTFNIFVVMESSMKCLVPLYEIELLTYLKILCQQKMEEEKGNDFKSLF